MQRNLQKKTTIDVTFSGTTNVSVFILGNRLLCSNVGDSRAVLGSLKSEASAKSISADLQKLTS